MQKGILYTDSKKIIELNKNQVKYIIIGIHLMKMEFHKILMNKNNQKM